VNIHQFFPWGNHIQATQVNFRNHLWYKAKKERIMKFVLTFYRIMIF
jgi:hypothetical protein